MKRYTILFILMAVILSSGVYGQEQKTKKSQGGQLWVGKPQSVTIKGFTPPGVYHWDPFLPKRDTVIMRGEEIEVGGYLSEQVIKEFEIVGFGKSKKSDLEKGFYIIKLKPKQTITYEFKWTDLSGGLSSTPRTSGRIVYVAKTEEEKKQLEEKLKASWQSPWQRTTYQPKNTSGIKINAVTTSSVKK